MWKVRILNDLSKINLLVSARERFNTMWCSFHYTKLVKLENSIWSFLGMAIHSSVLAWRIPGTGEPGGLPSLGSHRVRHDWSDLAAAAAGSAGGQRTWLPIQEKWEVDSIPGQEDPLEESMATHSSTLVWRIPWTEEPGRLQFIR